MIKKPPPEPGFVPIIAIGACWAVIKASGAMSRAGGVSQLVFFRRGSGRVVELWSV